MGGLFDYQSNGGTRAANAAASGGFSEVMRLFAGGGRISTPQPVMTGELGVEATYDPATGQFGLVGQGGPQVTQANPGTVVIPNHVIEAAVRADPGMIQRIFNPQGAQPPQPVAQAGPQMMAGPGGQPMPAMAAGGAVPAMDPNAIFNIMGGAQSGLSAPSSTPWYQKAAAWGQSPEGQNSLRLASNFGAALAPNNQAVQGLNGAMNQNYQSGAFGRQVQNNLGGPVSATQTQPMGGGQPGGKTGSGPGQSLANTQMRPDTGNIFNPQRNFNQGAAAAGSVSPFGAPALNYNPVPGLSPQDQVAALNGSLNMRQQSMLEQQMMAEQQAAMIEAQRTPELVSDTLSPGQVRVFFDPTTGRKVSAWGLEDQVTLSPGEVSNYRDMLTGQSRQIAGPPKIDSFNLAPGNDRIFTDAQGNETRRIQGPAIQQTPKDPDPWNNAATDVANEEVAKAFLPLVLGKPGEDGKPLTIYDFNDPSTGRFSPIKVANILQQLGLGNEYNDWVRVVSDGARAGKNPTELVNRLIAEKRTEANRLPAQDFTQPEPSLFQANPQPQQYAPLVSPKNPAKNDPMDDYRNWMK